MADLATPDAPAAPSVQTSPPHIAVDTAAVPARELAEAGAGAAPQHSTASGATAAPVAVLHQPTASERDDGSESSGEAEAEEPGEDMQAVLFNLLQRKMPGTKITCHALGMLERLLDEVVQKVLTEAVQSGSGNDASGEGGSALGQSEPLTSLAIQKAVKRLLPEGPLRPSLPAEVKKCVHLDKQSLRGFKRRRGAAAAAGEAARAGGAHSNEASEKRTAVDAGDGD